MNWPSTLSKKTFSDRAANTEGENTDGRREVRAAVATLPPAQRQALELLKLRELSLKEAAEQTEMSETALKVATHRGDEGPARSAGQEQRAWLKRTP